MKNSDNVKILKIWDFENEKILIKEFFEETDFFNSWKFVPIGINLTSLICHFY